MPSKCPIGWYFAQAAIVIPLIIYYNVVVSNQYAKIVPWSPPPDALASGGEESWIVNSPGCGVDTGGCGSDIPHKLKYKELFQHKMLCNHLDAAWHTPWTGRLVDSSGDLQWSAFNNNFSSLCLFFFMFVVGRRYFLTFCVERGVSTEDSNTWYYCGVGVFWVCYLHYFNALLVLAILSLHFFFTQRFVATKYFTLMLWVIHVALLLLIQFAQSHKIGQLLGGDMMDWSSCYPLLALRMLSHGLDLRRRTDPAEEGPNNGVTLKLRALARASDEDAKNILLYFAYVLYSPLYLAGPIMTFNTFVSYIHRGDMLHTTDSVLNYVKRFFACLLLMEVAIMFFYHFAIARTRTTAGSNGKTVWEQLFEGHLFLALWFSYMLLKMIWLKFLVIWRFGRMVTLLDGMDCHENMPHCMSNHRSIKAFWQSWHASFNQWLLRYIYIPLGGNRIGLAMQIRNTACVFLFVALWHQVSFQLFCWAGLLMLFMIPEILFSHLANSAMIQNFSLNHPQAWDRLQTLAGAVMIVSLKVACVVGFGYDIDGLGTILSLFAGWQQVLELLLYVCLMYSAVRLMQFAAKYTKARDKEEEFTPYYDEQDDDEVDYDYDDD